MPYLISKNKLYDVTSFNYKNNQYQSIEGSTYEELTFKNNEIQEIKVFKDNNLQTQLKFSSGYSNMNEASYFINGKLVLTDFMQFASKLYSYEFEDGVNLSLKQLENKIKEGDAALASKNFDKALEIYSECSNDYPPNIELNKRIENSINNAENKQNIYLQKIEKERLAQEKKRQAIFMAELAEGLKKYDESRHPKKRREEPNRPKWECTHCHKVSYQDRKPDHPWGDEIECQEAYDRKGIKCCGWHAWVEIN